MNYPMVFYPEVVTKFCHQYPLELKRKNKVAVSCTREQSVLKEPSPPQSPIVPSVKQLGLIWLLWLAGAIALLLLAVSWGWSWLELLLLVSAYSCLMVAAYTYVLARRHQLLSQYQQRLLEYQEQLAKYQEQQSLSGSQPQQLSIAPQIQGERRYQALADLMSKRVNPIGRSNVRQGVSEEKFLQYLQCYFPTTVQGVEFKIPMSRKCYSADFIIVHSLSGISMDVEVDEPYAGFSKKPTHCWDEDSDRRRNQLFNEWGWIVVRFTEKQVVQAPLSCCKFIALVIAQVTGDRSYLEALAAQPDLLPVKPWTALEALRMARDSYRQTYLPKPQTASYRQRRNCRQQVRRKHANE